MRSRNSLMRERQEAFRDARLIVIASEGKDTERIVDVTSLSPEEQQQWLENRRNSRRTDPYLKMRLDTVSLSVSERRHKKGTCRFVQVPRSL